MNKIFNNPQQAAASKMNMPNAAEMAEKLIYSRPDLFTGGLEETKIVIALAMVNFGIACNKFLEEESKPKSNMHPIFADLLKPFGIK
jgi:hypothetical protein